MHLDTVTGFRGGIERAAAEAREAEALGFDGMWTVEVGHDPFLALGLAAAATQRIGLGTNVAIAFGRSPLATAQVAWDLQRLSGGRLMLGLGTQVRAHVERRYSMPFDHPAARVTDYIHCLRAIWRTFQEDVRPDHRGPFYQFTLMNPFFNPGPIEHPDIPVYLAGVNPRMCRAVGEAADGFSIHPMHSVGYLREVALPAIADGARAAGREAAAVALLAPVFVITGDDQAEWDRCEQMTRRQIAFYASTPSYRAVLEHHGHGALGPELSALARNGDWTGMARRVPESLVAEIALAAAPADLAAALRARYAGLSARVSVYDPPLPWPQARWRSLLADWNSPTRAP
ncbi:MAG: TIGR03617 family F420-dependent LLM class oxidoreductase [Ectothiorhodospiraceae bacterium]|nr:TIGR03617 family F420-dependent LLM class oxidoreductase [Chromatiales bacterium]MCP5154375.1 TIGR03617 family F420-dependent LLM class oxidoreductase [Ectothiorhodospiraceae bacterium]